MEVSELEALLTKVGSKYKLVTMFQKRMRELLRGLPRLVEVPSGNVWHIVNSEIMQSKVDLIMGEEAEQMRKDVVARETEESNVEKKSDKTHLQKPTEEVKR
ncbi:MAG: DNA-directed RNA polymerase subunit omega [Planctomycetota bacterium]